MIPCKYKDYFPVGTIIERKSSIFPPYIISSMNADMTQYNLRIITDTFKPVQYLHNKYGEWYQLQSTHIHQDWIRIDADLLKRLLEGGRINLIPVDKADDFIVRHPLYNPEKWKKMRKLFSNMYNLRIPNGTYRKAYTQHAAEHRRRVAKQQAVLNPS
jgi:hypothetical protein